MELDETRPLREDPPPSRGTSTLTCAQEVTQAEVLTTSSARHRAAGQCAPRGLGVMSGSTADAPGHEGGADPSADLEGLPPPVGTMQSLRFLSAEALASHPQVARRSLDGAAHSLYPLLFKASYVLEQAEVIRVLLEHWPLEEFRLGALLGPSADHPEDLRDRACRACLEACVRGLADHVLRGGGRRRRLRVADLTGIRDVQVQGCPCGRALGRWGRTELLARTCCELQAEARAARHPIEVLADIFVTGGSFELVVRALGPAGPAPMRLRCLSFRADSLGAEQLLHVLRLAGPGELRRLEVVHNVRLHAGHVQQLLAQVGFPRLVSLTLPIKALDAPPASTPAPDGEDPLLTSIAWELSQMTQLTELSVAFCTLTGKLQKLLSPLRTPLRALDLGHCALDGADVAFLASCRHAAHLETLDLSGHRLPDPLPSAFLRLLGRAAPTLAALTLEDCGLADRHVGALGAALGACRRLRELRLPGNPLSARALRSLLAALCALPRLRRVELPVPRDCYPEGGAYPLDGPAAAKFDRQRYDAIAGELRALLLRAGRGDIRVCTPLSGDFDPDTRETGRELGAHLRQALATALEGASRALRHAE
ncbi:leucine-rich repeat-containing protein 14B [Hippopotamus amphibius kiboko]|uniref:leucine-rich repeat-containing protein 14B n=1 Tax=Hippopotamus amphibius kiboko TaxID=575201 RepID=UPI002591DDDF|nr:leucine-rich repeat-containing protein 14B [Hippopotamus amphibius kiboko]